MPPEPQQPFCDEFNHSGVCTLRCPPAAHQCNCKGCDGAHPGRICPLCMLPLRTAQPILTDLDLKSLFDPILTTISTPVNVNLLHQELRNHPNQSLVSYLLEGFTNGCDIGYTGEHFPVCTKNLLSALHNPGPVSETISKELSQGHIAGPFTSPPFPNLHCSPLGCVPKKDGPYKLIIDLSSPPGRSVNENIPKDSFQCFLQNLMMQLNFFAPSAQVH